MANGDDLRIKSVEMDARALIERHPEVKAKLQELAAVYRRLADEADSHEIVAKD